MSDGNFSLNHNDTNQVGENLIWVHGKHNFTFGGDFRRLDFNQLSQQNPRGSFCVHRRVYRQRLRRFPAGLPATSSIAYGNADKYFRTSWLDGFVNDDWRMKSNFSLNFGLRWDFQAPVTELYNRLVNLNIGPNFTTETPVCATPAHRMHHWPARPAIPILCSVRTITNFSRASASPGVRLNGHSTVVRAGYGIYYNTSVYQPLASRWRSSRRCPSASRKPNSSAHIRAVHTGRRFPDAGRQRNAANLRDRSELPHRLPALLAGIGAAEPGVVASSLR